MGDRHDSSKLAFPHGRERRKGGLDIERCTAASRQECEYPSPAQNSHALALGFLYWCWGSADKSNLEPWSTVKSNVVGFWQVVRTCKVQKECYCSLRRVGL